MATKKSPVSDTAELERATLSTMGMSKDMELFAEALAKANGHPDPKEYVEKVREAFDSKE